MCIERISLCESPNNFGDESNILMKFDFYLKVLIV